MTAVTSVAWHLRLRQYYSDHEEADEIASNYDIETPQYKEKQTILPQPLSEIEKKLQTPVKRTHDGKIKVKTDSPIKYQEGPNIDMRKLERKDDLSTIISNGKLLKNVTTPHKSKKKDKNHDKSSSSSEKKKKSSKKEKSSSIPTASISIDTYNLNREDTYKRLHNTPVQQTPSDKENNVNVNSIDSMTVKESEPVSCEIISMEMDIPVVAEEIVVEETVIDSSSTIECGEPSSDQFHISIQSTPHYSEEVVTETIVPFPNCSQTAP